MPRTLITRVAIPAVASGGLNLTDAAFTTLGVGADNGIECLYTADAIVVLKNDTGGAAVFTFVISNAAITAQGGAVTSPTLNVANGKTYLVKLADIFQDTSSPTKFRIDCDVAAKVIVR